MADNSRDFTFDINELDQLISRANGFIGFLTESLDGINNRIAAIQQNWQGTLPAPRRNPTENALPGPLRPLKDSLRCTMPLVR